MYIESKGKNIGVFCSVRVFCWSISLLCIQLCPACVGCGLSTDLRGEVAPVGIRRRAVVSDWLRNLRNFTRDLGNKLLP